MASVSTGSHPYMVERAVVSAPDLLYRPECNAHAPGRYRLQNYPQALASCRSLNYGEDRPFAIYRWSLVERKWVRIGDPAAECPT